MWRFVFVFFSYAFMAAKKRERKWDEHLEEHLDIV